MRTIKDIVTEAVARRKVGKYGFSVSDLRDYPHPTYPEIMDWIEENHIKTEDIPDFDSKDIRDRIGKGIAILGRTRFTRSIILCPANDNRCAYQFRFENQSDEIDEAILHELTQTSIFNRNKTIQQLIGLLNGLNRENNFMTEAVARRTTGKYSYNITVDSTQDDFERFIKSTPLNIQEMVHTDTFIQKIDDVAFGTGICYVNRNMGRNSTEYIICPEGETYRYDLLYTDGKLYQALRTERYGNRVRTNFSKDKETVLKEITEYYNG